MKVSILNWKTPLTLIMLSAGIFLYSCDNNDYSGNSSTTSTTDTISNMTDHTTVMADTVTANDTTSMTSSSTASARKGRTGSVAVAPVSINKMEKMASDQTGYYNYAEVSPAYSGGQGAIETYIVNNLTYPEEAIDNNIEGTINVQFGIDENGNVSNVKVIGNKLGYGLDEEAVKVISNMPKWTPGAVKGKKVKTKMILPITYRLEE